LCADKEGVEVLIRRQSKCLADILHFGTVTDKGEMAWQLGNGRLFEVERFTVVFPEAALEATTVAGGIGVDVRRHWRVDLPRELRGGEDGACSIVVKRSQVRKLAVDEEGST
jgi:hypothetical protein